VRSLPQSAGNDLRADRYSTRSGGRIVVRKATSDSREWALPALEEYLRREFRQSRASTFASNTVELAIKTLSKKGDLRREDLPPSTEAMKAILRSGRGMRPGTSKPSSYGS
jgi:hypothetical protein